MIKQQFGFQKARLRGMTKNHGKVVVLAALTNLFLARKRLLTRVLAKGKQGKPPLALAWGFGKPDGEREDRGKELCCVLLCRLSRPCRGVRGRFPNQAWPDRPDPVSVSFKQVEDPLLRNSTLALFCYLDDFAKLFEDREPHHLPGTATPPRRQALPR